MKFETPIAEVKKFDLVDVLTASSATTSAATTSEEIPMFDPPCA